MVNRRWALVPLALSLLIGIGIGLYLTWHHELEVYGQVAVDLGYCPESEDVNCTAVNTSVWSELFGTPIALLAAVTYLLLIWLAAAAWRRREGALAYTFTLGLLTVVYSAYLYWVSVTHIGFLCLWCVRMYAVNLSIPLLAWVAAGTHPLRLVRAAVRDLGRWPPLLRQSALVFVVVALAAVVAQRAWRADLVRRAAAIAEATPDLPELAVAPAVAAEPSAAPPSPAAYALPAPVQVLERRGSEVAAVPFDLQVRIGRGRPVALLFWAPGYRASEEAAIATARFLTRELPDFEVFAVAGRRADRKPDMLHEACALLGLPADVPCLADEAFALSNALKVSDVPNAVVFDRAGGLVTTRLKALDAVLTYVPEQLTGEALLRAVAAAPSHPPVQRPQPAFPGEQRKARCAPAFSLPRFDGGADFEFAGRSPADRPTLLFFWSSTCRHCQQEMPHLVAHHRENQARYDVIGVTRIRKDREGQPSHRTVTQRYIQASGIEFPVLEDVDGAVSDLYGVVSTPTAFIIAPSGEVRRVWYYANPDFPAAMETALADAAAAAPTCAPFEPPAGPALAFEAVTPEGATAALPGAIGRPALVHLWATWCEPCKKELPSLLRFREKARAAGAEVVFVSVEDADAGPAIAAFESRSGLQLGSLRAPSGGLAAAVDLAYSVPRTFVVGADGRVLDTLYGQQHWDAPDLVARTLSRLRNAPAR